MALTAPTQLGPTPLPAQPQNVRRPRANHSRLSKAALFLSLIWVILILFAQIVEQIGNMAADVKLVQQADSACAWTLVGFGITGILFMLILSLQALRK